MSGVPQIRRLNREAWGALVPRFADYNYRQCWHFGQAAARRVGAVCENVAIERARDPVALANVRIKRLPIVGGGLAYISGGPLVREFGAVPADARASLELALEALVSEYVHRRGFVLKVNPQLGDHEWGAELTRAFPRAGFTPAPGETAYRTIEVDITRSEPALRAGLAQKWRNCLNSAERQGLRVIEDGGPESFRVFGALYAEISSRKGFEADLDAAFFGSVQAHLSEGERFRVLLAYQGDQPVAGYVGTCLGETSVYLLGASSEAGRQSKAGYLLQWRAILDAKALGCGRHDLGGIDPEGNPGVYRFKCGLGGSEITSPGPFEAHSNGLRSAITRYGVSLYRRARGRSRPGVRDGDIARSPDGHGAVSVAQAGSP